MTYNKKRALSYGGILISVLLAYFCRLVRPENVFMQMPDCNWLSDGILVLCADGKISYSS